MEVSRAEKSAPPTSTGLQEPRRAPGRGPFSPVLALPPQTLPARAAPLPVRFPPRPDPGSPLTRDRRALEPASRTPLNTRDT